MTPTWMETPGSSSTATAAHAAMNRRLQSGHRRPSIPQTASATTATAATWSPCIQPAFRTSIAPTP